MCIIYEGKPDLTEFLIKPKKENVKIKIIIATNKPSLTYPRLSEIGNLLYYS